MEIPTDSELIALQSELDKRVDDWRTEYEARDLGKADYHEQDVLRTFLLENWDPESMELDLVIAKKAWEDEDSIRGIDLIPDHKRRMSQGGLHLVTLDAFHVIGGEKKYRNVSFDIKPMRSGIQVIIEPNSQAVLNLLPDEIQGFQFVRKNSDGETKHFEPKIKVEIPYKKGKEQDIGYKIHSLPSLATAWQEANKLGEELIVKLKDGRTMIIHQSQKSVVEPQVNFSDGETSKPGKMSVFEFFRQEPEVI